MRRECGFTLIEALITALVLSTGLAGVAVCFSYTVQCSIRIRQQSTALALLTTKMEELRAGSALDPGQYAEDIRDSETYRLIWEITSEVPQRVTIIVSHKRPGLDETYEELARASTLVGPKF